MNFLNICIPFLSLLTGTLFRIAGAQGFVSPILDPEVISSPAFITSQQFYQALNVSLPFLPSPISNSTLTRTIEKNRYVYPDFINYSIKIGNITTMDEMAMFLAQVLYQSNGLSANCDPACKDPGSTNCMNLNLNTTVFSSNVNYYGRGYLWIQGQSAYTECAKDLFGNDSTLLIYPDAIRASDSLNWAATSWYWRRMVQPNMSTFGSTIKLIRPSHCNGSAAAPKPEATNAWNLYAAILKILAPTSPPSSSYC